MDRKALVFIAMGFEAVALILVCFYLGNWADEKFGLLGLGSVIGAMIGLIAWVVHLLAVARVLAKQEESRHTDQQ